MLIVIKNEYCHKVPKTDAFQCVLLVNNTIFDEILSYFCKYSLFIRVLVFKYSYERIWESIRIVIVVVVRSNEPRIPNLRIRGYECLRYGQGSNFTDRARTLDRFVRSGATYQLHHCGLLVSGQLLNNVLEFCKTRKGYPPRLQKSVNFSNLKTNGRWMRNKKTST